MTYLICPNKGQHRKDIAVCHQCQDRADCNEYQLYVQPEIDFETQPKSRRKQDEPM